MTTQQQKDIKYLISNPQFNIWNISYITSQQKDSRTKNAHTDSANWDTSRIFVLVKRLKPRTLRQVDCDNYILHYKQEKHYKQGLY